MKSKIAVIEPDRKNAKLINSILCDKFTVFITNSLTEGYSVITSEKPDIIIIDPLFPKSEGIEFIEELRSWNDCYIIAISSNCTERAAVTALNSGADDFIRKPFFTEELKARISSAQKQVERLKAAKGIKNSSFYKHLDLTLNYHDHSLIIDQKPIHLTKNEYKILELLCKNSGKVLTYDYILKSVWGPRTDSNTGILRVNIANLRKKLEFDPLNPKYLFTENGIGYRVPENGDKNERI